MSSPLIEPLRYFVGEWSIQAEDPGTKNTATLIYVVEPILDGVWLRGHGNSPELAIEVEDMWGVDPVTREIVRAIFDTRGTYGIARSRGWERDTLVLEGEARTAGGVVHVRETIVRAGPDHFTARWEAESEGRWTAYSVENARRRT